MSNTTDTPLALGAGTVLPNGAVVIAASLRNAHEWIILAMRPGLRSGEAYVTWKCSRPGNGSDTVHGHYFDSIVDAANDFASRP